MMGVGAVLLMSCHAGAADSIDLSEAVVLVRPGELPNAESAAALVLTEEIEKRSGIRLDAATDWPSGKTVIAITSAREVTAWTRECPELGSGGAAEGYRLVVDASAAETPVVWVLGADARGTLYGVGALLRQLDWAEGVARIPATLDVTTAPAYPIRGHQLGFRDAANSYDAWTVAQYDQYIRELTFFGINSVENIPFQDDRANPLMKVSRDEMNRAMSAICERYGLDYWVWAPADYDLADAEARAKGLEEHAALYADCSELTGVFVPGGDPGSNPPELVLPFLEDLAERLHTHHSDAKVWLSLQWFNREQVMYIRDYLEREAPTWLGGLVAGPSSPPIPPTRLLLPKQYKYRLYPDITHNKICQYPVPWWDQAYALTLGREAINPRPTQYAYIHNWFAPYSDGFISYSDGAHDDVNKTIWSALSWDPTRAPRDILIEYARVFLDPAIVEETADGIFALEKNWRGVLATNGGVEATLRFWQALEARMPGLETNWRWQMFLVRANYDAYIRHRLLRESKLENEANAVLAQAGERGADAAMDAAMAILNRAVEKPVSPELHARVVDLYEKLFQSVGLQSSVEKYHASGAERGASLDFVDYPMNNRWWLEDEFEKVRQLGSETEKC